MSGMYHPLPKTVRVELGRTTQGGGGPEPGGEPGLRDGVLRESARAERREAGALWAVEGGCLPLMPGGLGPGAGGGSWTGALPLSHV